MVYKTTSTNDLTCAIAHDLGINWLVNRLRNEKKATSLWYIEIYDQILTKQMCNLEWT